MHGGKKRSLRKARLEFKWRHRCFTLHGFVIFMLFNVQFTMAPSFGGSFRGIAVTNSKVKIVKVA